MNIRETLDALVVFLTRGHQSGNTTAAIHGVGHVGAAPGGQWEQPRLVLPTEQDASRARKHLRVRCMPLSDPNHVRMAPAGPVVFDTYTVEVLAIAALQRIQALEAEREALGTELEALRDGFSAAEEAANYCGEALNNMDAVDEEDMKKTTPLFERIQKARGILDALRSQKEGPL